MNDTRQSDRLRIFDCHAHIYSQVVITNVKNLNGLADALRLDVGKAVHRTDKSSLTRECKAAGVEACLLLPTAPAKRVHQTNELALETVKGDKSLFTAGTVHPSAPEIEVELEWLGSHGIRALKLCSFSQGFDLEAEDTLQLFEKIRNHNVSGKLPFFVVLDTFYQADRYFRAPKNYLTTPRNLSRLVAHFPEINFLAAHMGGLAAPYPEIEEHLLPKNNLFLDTSNASQVMTREQFLRLLRIHGPERILFGTDWPWFSHVDEVPRIAKLLQEAGYDFRERSRVFSGNICGLLGI